MHDLVFLGGGGHAASVLAALSGRYVRGYLAPQRSDRVLDLHYLGDDDVLDDFDPSEIEVVNALGSISSTTARRRLHRFAVARAFTVATVVHPHARVDPRVTLGAGAQVLAGAIVNAGARIGEGALINTGAIVEHDTVVGDHAHLAPGAVVAGDVRIESDAFVGLGARVIQGVTIGSGSVIGAGAVVLSDVPPAATVVGMPAHQIRQKDDRP